ncbi:GrpB family protein [Alicyclobacillus shizuokensis]|uniref:GrpB family protein n=1 Tax=Alicyclobacillus shizuokensis TaxID=392014 RepID=UPI0008328FA2|nr:GrpB family protein [Alicyclobacillus shizuokensis]MCL6625325.1 GrpB family protein [Alicyclobacillus shizuokensis]
MGSNVTVQAYNPSWVQVFERIRDSIIPVLGDILVTVEHVGSTSVPGLAAKPIIDLDAVVYTQSDVQTAIQRLATIGYVHEGDLGITGREAFIPPDGTPCHHLYVCTADNAEYKRHVLFRDYLRSHPQDAKRYGDLKMELAQRFPNNRAAYTNGKNDFVKEILKRAGLE